MLDAPSEHDLVFEDAGVSVVMSPLDHKQVGSVAIDWLGDEASGMFWIHPVTG